MTSQKKYFFGRSSTIDLIRHQATHTCMLLHKTCLMVDTTTTRSAVVQSCTAINPVARTCRSRRRERPRVCRSAASTWSPPPTTTATSAAALVLPRPLSLLLLLLLVLLSGAEAAGLWGLGGGGRAGQPQGGSWAGHDDGGMDEVFAKVQEDQVLLHYRRS